MLQPKGTQFWIGWLGFEGLMVAFRKDRLGCNSYDKEWKTTGTEESDKPFGNLDGMLLM